MIATDAKAFSGEAKIYCRATIGEDFDDSSVLVVMDKNVGGINKTYSKNFFGGFPKKAVYDLTYISNDIDSSRVDKENFSQILQIKLLEKSKKNVLSIIKQLETREGIKYVGPNYYDSPAAIPHSASGMRYSSLWGMHGNLGIQAEYAWEITTGVRDNVRVGVIDNR